MPLSDLRSVSFHAAVNKVVSNRVDVPNNLRQAASDMDFLVSVFDFKSVVEHFWI